MVRLDYLWSNKLARPHRRPTGGKGGGRPPPFPPVGRLRGRASLLD